MIMFDYSYSYVELNCELFGNGRNLIYSSDIFVGYEFPTNCVFLLSRPGPLLSAWSVFQAFIGPNLVRFVASGNTNFGI